mmetsp:Transcript_20109/g.44014  ORF Transcript_20109/g.44014 Transcript_20109/m.44014 type:complete len:215 (-) Transcript_20109:2318-2962(-)
MTEGCVKDEILRFVCLAANTSWRRCCFAGCALAMGDLRLPPGVVGCFLLDDAGDDALPFLFAGLALSTCMNILGFFAFHSRQSLQHVIKYACLGGSWPRASKRLQLPTARQPSSSSSSAKAGRWSSQYASWQHSHRNSSPPAAVALIPHSQQAWCRHVMSPPWVCSTTSSPLSYRHLLWYTQGHCEHLRISASHVPFPQYPAGSQQNWQSLEWA